MTILTTFLAGLLYLAATLHIARQIRAGHAERRSVFLYAGFAAVLCHGTVTLPQVFLPQGIALGLFTAGSLVGMLVALLAIITSLFRPVGVIALVAYPVAFSLLLLAELLHDRYTPRQFSSGLGVHILLSLLAWAVIAIATAHAALLTLQDQLLRARRLDGLLRVLPPLQTTEAILFELLAAGFALLTLAIGAGFLYVDDLFAQHLVHKTVLTLASWAAIGVLLAGRKVAGWRGRTAVRFTVGAFLLLAIAFFGSKFVLEMVLQRG